jgi:hypothetical protein
MVELQANVRDANAASHHFTDVDGVWRCIDCEVSTGNAWQVRCPASENVYGAARYTDAQQALNVAIELSRAGLNPRVFRVVDGDIDSDRVAYIVGYV